MYFILMIVHYNSNYICNSFIRSFVYCMKKLYFEKKKQKTSINCNGHYFEWQKWWKMNVSFSFELKWQKVSKCSVFIIFVVLTKWLNRIKMSLSIPVLAYWRPVELISFWYAMPDRPFLATLQLLHMHQMYYTIPRSIVRRYCEGEGIE